MPTATAIREPAQAPIPPAPVGGRTWRRWLLLAVIAAGTTGYLTLRSRDVAGVQFGCAFAALAGFGVLMALESRRPLLTHRSIWVCAVALLCVAVALPPQGSRDIWAYAMYGRIVSAHGASPYRHTPADFSGDPWEARVAPAWRHSPSVYGPLFTAVSAAGMAAVGDSPTGGRLWFQGLAALAVLAALLVVRRVRGDPLALAFIGLNPVVLGIVNGGHNDLLAGLAVLAGVVLAGRRTRLWVAGVVLAAGALVKIAALLPLGAVVAWLLWRHGSWRRGVRDALEVGATAGGCLIASYLLAGGWGAVAPLEQASNFESRASMWGPHLLGRYFGRSDWWALAAVALAVLLVVAGGLRQRTAVLAAGGAAVVYLVAAPYVLPWYAGWAIPVLALAWRSRLAVLALIDASLLMLVYADRPGLDPSWLHHGLQQTAVRGLPGFELGAIVLLCVLSAHRALVR